MLTNSKTEMGNRFKNSTWVRILGWISVLGLTFLNMKGLPASIEAFFGNDPTAAQVTTADTIAYIIIALIIALLVWTVTDIYRGDKRLAKEQAQRKQSQE